MVLSYVSTFQTASSWLYLFCYFKLCICSQNFPHELRFNVKGAFVFVLSNSAFWNLQVAIQCKFHRNLRRHGILRSNITTTTARNILSLSHRRKWTTQKRFTLRWSTIFQSSLSFNYLFRWPASLVSPAVGECQVTGPCFANLSMTMWENLSILQFFLMSIIPNLRWTKSCSKKDDQWPLSSFRVTNILWNRVKNPLKDIVTFIFPGLQIHMLKESLSRDDER